MPSRIRQDPLTRWRKQSSSLSCSSYGISDETHQYFVPNRDASFFDFIADVVGGSVGIWLVFTMKKMRSPREENASIPIAERRSTHD